MFKLGKIALITTALFVASAASAQQQGPNPTASSLERTGPFSTSSTSVSSFSASGFGGGRLYYPTTSGTFGAIALCPGFTAGASSLSWMGTRLASHGFVVLIIDTNSRFDQPGSRARQLKSATDYLVSQNSRTGSPIRGKVDTSRLAIGGHSMGGGGSLEAAEDNPSYKATLPLTPWHTTKSFRSMRVPTMIIGGSADSVAPDRSHSQPFYNSIPSTTPKFYIQLRGASHFFPQSSDPIVSRHAISWYKRWVDSDTRYSQFLNGSQPSGTSEYQRSGSF